MPGMEIIMKKIRKLVTVTLTLSLAFSLAACGSENSSNNNVTANSRKTQNVVYRTLDEIKESGTINIGVFSDKNPFGYVDENGEYQGYDVYFANRIGEDLGVKINYISTEAANRIEYLQTGKADIILANFTVTPQRAEEVDFALPYMNVALGVVSPDSRVIESLDNWNAEDPIIVISGTTAETYLIENYPDIPLQKYDSYATAKNAWKMGTGPHGPMTIPRLLPLLCRMPATLWEFRPWAVRTVLHLQFPKGTARFWTG